MTSKDAAIQNTGGGEAPSILQRPNNWRVLLVDHVMSKESQPFEWGINDCALFAADAVKVMTGVDFAAEYRDGYKTQLGASRKLARAGYSDLEDLASKTFIEVPPLTAQMGDLAIIPTDLGPALGIVLGADVATASGHVPLTTIKRAFRV